MNRELLRDLIVDGIESSYDSKLLKCICWTGIGISALYFCAVFVWMWAR